MPYGNSEQQAKANAARSASKRRAKPVPRPALRGSSKGKEVAVRNDKFTHRSPSSYTTGNSTSNTGVARRTGSDVVKRTSGTVARTGGGGPKGPSKAWRFGRAIRVGGGPVALIAAGTYEAAKYGVDQRNRKNAKGYYLTPEKNKEGQWSPTGVHGQYRKRDVQNAAKRRSLSERNYTTYGGKEQNKPRLSDAKKEWTRERKAALSSPSSRYNKSEKLTEANQEALYNYRLNRRLRGDFKGKYYGPDEFKGNEKKLARWRAAGSPKNKSKFA